MSGRYTTSSPLPAVAATELTEAVIAACVASHARPSLTPYGRGFGLCVNSGSVSATGLRMSSILFFTSAGSRRCGPSSQGKRSSRETHSRCGSACGTSRRVGTRGKTSVSLRGPLDGRVITQQQRSPRCSAVCPPYLPEAGAWESSFAISKPLSAPEGDEIPEARRGLPSRDGPDRLRVEPPLRPSCTWLRPSAVADHPRATRNPTSSLSYVAGSRPAPAIPASA